MGEVRFRLDNALHARLNAYARAKKVSQAEAVELILDEHFKAVDKCQK